MRAFVAVEVSDPGIRDAIAEFQDGFPVRAKAIGPDSLHFTLIFLGEISESQNRQVQDSLGTIAFEPFEIKLAGVGAFPNTRSPRIIWIGTDPIGGRRLTSLAGAVCDRLLPLNFRNDRPFVPHVTVFRVRNRVDVSEDLAGYGDAGFGACIISKIKLKQSVLTPQGPRYSDLQVISA